MNAERDGTNISLDLNFDFRTSGICFDFSHELGFYYSYKLDIEIPTVETNEDNIDSFLEDQKRPYLNFGGLDFEEFCDLNFLLKNIDTRIKRSKFKKI